MTDSPEQLPLEVDVHHVKSLFDQQATFLLLDCREQQEFEVANISGSTLIPMSELQERVSELDDHRESHIIVHCHHGARSLRVAHWLRNQDFTKVQNMAGGIDDWSLQIDESVPRY